ncbi:hypothetical protein [Chryseobacterium sp. 'Rf worker isolate 10']|uniref:hypothetical protein n=1 Tax=Chryseobacterium sp. 'Rf worker isolate 10' TaxID=2887348 RepID=UPI003D6F619F
MKISVVIPVYNAEKYVSQAVESALQFDDVHEVVLSSRQYMTKVLISLRKTVRICTFSLSINIT